MDSKAKSYLMKQLVVEKNIVTYRSLSRALSIHVNTAKEYLEAYLEQSTDCHAQYLIYGVPVRIPDEDEGYEVDDELHFIENGPRYAYTLTRAEDLEATKKTFKSIEKIFVHNLAPTMVKEENLVAGLPYDLVRKADVEGGPELAAIVGRVVGEDVKAAWARLKLGKGKAKAPARPAEAKLALTKGNSKDVISSTTATTATAAPAKLKPAGTLTFGKAKAKETKEVKKLEEPPKVEPPLVKVEKAVVIPTESNAGSSSKRQDSLMVPQRGQKRKSEAETNDADNEPSKAVPQLKASSSTSSLRNTNGNARVTHDVAAVSSKPTRRKNNIVISDEEDEEDEDHPVRAVAKPKADSRSKRKALAGSDDEDELDKVMNMDDSEVIRTTARQATSPPTSEDGMAQDDMDVDEDMDVDDVPKKQRKPKAPKKVIPVGSNGLKKKRVVKTRTAFDAKGFMVTEDYSEYESVDEEEPEAESQPKKSAAKTKKASAPVPPPVKKISSSDAPIRKPAQKKAAASGASKGAQQGIGSFFAKKK